MTKKSPRKKIIPTTHAGNRAVTPPSRAAWRKWLSQNYKSTEPVWLAIFHKTSQTPNLTYADAVEEALCFGWIDNRANKRDEESMFLRFVPRKKNSNWSKVNRERAERMIKEKKMKKAGMVFVEEAKANGRWEKANKEHTMPTDLTKAFSKKKKALENFEAFTPYQQGLIIQWINEAKTEDTRKRRVEKTVKMAGQNLKAFP
jgi:uncharacterized protein YdeI (YjbR/CyaY-like superfamily)